MKVSIHNSKQDTVFSTLARELREVNIELNVLNIDQGTVIIYYVILCDIQINITLLFYGKLVHDEKDNFKWFPERSEFCNTYPPVKMVHSEIVSASYFPKTLHKRKQFLLR